MTLDEVSNALSRRVKVDNALLPFPSKRTVYAVARTFFCYPAHRAGFTTLNIGNFPGTQQAALSNAARKGAPMAEMLSRAIDVDYSKIYCLTPSVTYKIGAEYEYSDKKRVTRRLSTC